MIFSVNSVFSVVNQYNAIIIVGRHNGLIAAV